MSVHYWFTWFILISLLSVGPAAHGDVAPPKPVEPLFPPEER
jgi:hypothetical protein